MPANSPTGQVYRRRGEYPFSASSREGLGHDSCALFSQTREGREGHQRASTGEKQQAPMAVLDRVRAKRKEGRFH